MNVVAKEMLLIIRIFFEALVVLDAFEHHLTETIKVCNIDHLRIDNFVHESACGALVVDLYSK